jgi:hypothetical protein
MMLPVGALTEMALVDEVVAHGFEGRRDLGEDLVLVMARLDQGRLAGRAVAGRVEDATVAGHIREGVCQGPARCS